MHKMSDTFSQLRDALHDVKSTSTKEGLTDVALNELKFTVDNTRSNILAMLSAEDSSHYSTILRGFRLQRATEICQNVTSGLGDGTIGAETPGIEQLKSTVRQALKRLESVNDNDHYNRF